jgi:hypothetical protein
MKRTFCIFSAALLVLISGCVTTQTDKLSYPSSDELYVTTGDGNFGEYTPVGQIYFTKTGFRIPLPILGLLPVADVDPSTAVRQEVKRRARRMGGDAVINLRVDWTPPETHWATLGTLSEGGQLIVYGNVIQRQ